MATSKQKLIIVESPAKAKTIGRYLGKGYKVEASQGHVCDLPKSQLGVNPDKDFEMKYITIRGRQSAGICTMCSAWTRTRPAGLNSMK